MKLPYPPAKCSHCGNRVPRAAAHRCPLCRTPFSRLPLPATIEDRLDQG
ncbi:hypothetical protein [Paracoccus sp. (in: a-proteobacteria)]|nr:hypothetical protein [Paracoccus sp. (in: a-proteobacteria)]MDO5370172.1 hypothetical protein [Paracoccus sp. (in: a-proteobacteria)]